MIPALSWRWARAQWVADVPVDVIAARLGLTRRQVYDHATRHQWPERQFRTDRPRPVQWRCECGRLVRRSAVCGCGQAAAWKAMVDAGLLQEVPR